MPGTGSVRAGRTAHDSADERKFYARPRTSAGQFQRWSSQNHSVMFFRETARAATLNLAEGSCHCGRLHNPGASLLGTAVRGIVRPGEERYAGPAGVAGRPCGGCRPCRQAAVIPFPVHGLREPRNFLLRLTFSIHELSPLCAQKSIFYEIISFEVKRCGTIFPGQRKSARLLTPAERGRRP